MATRERQHLTGCVTGLTYDLATGSHPAHHNLAPSGYVRRHPCAIPEWPKGLTWRRRGIGVAQGSPFGQLIRVRGARVARSSGIALDLCQALPYGVRRYLTERHRICPV